LAEALGSSLPLISGTTARPFRLEAETLMEMDEGFRNSGEPIEPQAPTPNVKPLEELEHLLSVLKAASGSYRRGGLVERFGPEGRLGRSA
jgi:hypothetical protein